MACPYCGSASAWRNGRRNGCQRWLCRNCGREYVERTLTRPLNMPAPTFVLAGAGEKQAERLVGAQTGTKKGGKVECEQIQNSGLLKAFPTGIQAKILQFIAHRENNNKQYANIVYALKAIQKAGANLYDPESVKAVIKKMPVQESTKKCYCDNYEAFLKWLGGKWEKPHYEINQKQYFIPSEAEIDQLIAGFTPKIAVFCQIAKETGASKGEIAKLKWTDIDFEQKIIRINETTKGHATRSVKISEKCLNMINEHLPHKNEKLFQSLKSISKLFHIQRKRIAHKLNNPRLLKITPHTFRHWVGTMEYHKTHSLGHVAQKLGHKNWKNTQVYITLEEVYFGQASDDFYTEVAKTVEEARKLFEAGWEYTHCNIDGIKIFRKRK